MNDSRGEATGHIETGGEREARSYRRKLLALVSSAGFFEGYDSFVLAFVTAAILRDLDVPVRHGGLVKGIVEVGAVAAFFLAMLVDRFGRRRLLLITISGYTVATFLTAFAPHVTLLTGLQLVARTFAGAEGAIATTMIVEEFPAGERGKAIGILASMGTLATIVVGLMGLFGFQDAFGWRAFYLVGIVPLVLVAIGRRGLRETERFTRVRATAGAVGLNQTSPWEPWRTPLRRSLLSIGALHFFRNLATASAVSWFAFYAEEEVGLSGRTTGLFLAVGAAVGVFGFLLGGLLMDRIGRRHAFILYTALSAVFGVVLFQSHRSTVVLAALCGAIFFGLGSGSMTNAFATEPFPTYVRGRAATWCRNFFEIPGGIVGPILVGFLGDPDTGVLESVGNAMTLLFAFMVIPVLLIAWRLVPETKDVNLAEMDAAATRSAGAAA
jgi:putative MFS transporter